MVVGDMITRVRRRSRTPKDFIDNDVIRDDIDEAIKVFARDVRGLIKHTYLALTPKFWTNTNLAIQLTITGGANALAETDIAITSTEREGSTGTVVAADLQTAIRAAGAATATVTWSTTTFKFTIDAIDSTSIEIGVPTTATYSDATDLLFAKVGSVTDTEWTGNVPQDVLIEVDLPSDFLTPMAVEWDRNPLEPATFDLFHSPQSHGTPFCYHIVEKTMRLFYVPTEQKLLSMWYCYVPDTLSDTQYAYQECGLSGKVGGDATGLATTTTYYFFVTVDNGEETEYSITTAADVTFTAVIALLNAAVSGVTWALSGGDLRCTTNSYGGKGRIKLRSGITGTDLFATLTDFSALDDPAGDLETEIEVENVGEDAILEYAIALRFEANNDEKRGLYHRQAYEENKRKYIAMIANKNPKYRQHKRQINLRNYRVSIG